MMVQAKNQKLTFEIEMCILKKIQFEFDKKIKKGLFSEDEAYDDYFTLDNLEAERERLKQISERL